MRFHIFTVSICPVDLELFLGPLQNYTSNTLGVSCKHIGISTIPTYHSYKLQFCHSLFSFCFGSGQIGQSWALLFASAGYKVALYDVIPENVTKGLEIILQQLKYLEKENYLRGSLPLQTQYDRISKADTVGECVKNAIYVQVSIYICMYPGPKP